MLIYISVSNQVKILIIERFPDNFKFVPEGICIFQYLWEKENNYFPKCYRVYDDNMLEKFTEKNVSDGDIIIISLYKDPLPFINEIISYIKNKRKNVKIFIGGPLALRHHDLCSKLISCDKVIGDINELLTHKHKLPEIIRSYPVINNQINIFPCTCSPCNNNCSFCPNSKYKSKFQSFTIDQIIDRTSLHKKNKNIEVGYADVFQLLSNDEIKDLCYRLYDKIRYCKISLWATAYNIIKNSNIIDDLSPVGTRIQWKIGLESFNKDQLLRYSSGYKNVQDNLRCIEIINSSKKCAIEPLIITLDPWSKPNELADTIKGLSKIKKSKMSCAAGGLVWKKTFISRIWEPYPDTELYQRALQENLLNTENYNEFGYYISSYKNLDFDKWPWKFKNTEMQEVVSDLFYWSYLIEWTQKELKKNNLSQCLLCPGGFGRKDLNNGRMLLMNLQKNLISYLSGDKNQKEEITLKIKNMVSKILSFNNIS